jgi:class 3 adenylate cyclase
VVNAAFRIQASTRQTGTDVAIGRGTVELLGGLPGMPDLNEQLLQLKGYDEGVKVWSASFESIRTDVRRSG